MNLTSITHSISGRIAAGAVGVAMTIALIGAAAPVSAAALTAAQVSSIISLLQSFGADAATIANVQASLTGGTPTSGGGSTSGSCFTRDLQVGSTGADVKALQQLLNKSASTQVAASGAGSPGNETTTFGPATKAAVIKFQTANSISPAAGYVGPKTRAALNTSCSGGTTGGGTTTPPPTGPGITVSAAAQPANSLAVASAARVPFTTFTLTNNTSAAVTINSVTVQRTGLGVDANFSGVVLLDSNGLQIGTARTFNSVHQTNIGDNFVLNAGASMTFTVAGNMANSSTVQAGQVVSLQVVAINTSAPVSGSLPISGASQTINATLTVGSVSTSTSSVVPPTSTTHTQNIGDTGVRFSGIKFTAGSTEDLKMYSIRWRQVGSASGSDISNIMTYANGVAYPTTISSDGKYYTTLFPGGLLIAKGNSLDVYVQGDLVGSGAAGRTVEFDIDKVTDVYFVGQLYGFGITPSGTSQSWYSGDVFNIHAGTASTIQKSNATADAAQNIAVNVGGQPLGGFVTNFLGEPVQVTTLKITIATSSNTIGPITNISITDNNGTVVAGPVDEASTCTTGCTVTFPDTVTFPVGSATYHIKGRIPSGATNGSTVQVSITPSGWSGVTGQTSGNTVSLASNGVFTLNTMTIQGATTTITMATNPPSQNFVPGGTQYEFANVQLDASQSGEDVRFSSLPMRPTLATAGDNTYITGCQLFDGNNPLNIGSQVVNSITSGSASTFTFTSPLVVSKGTVKTLALRCNVSSSISSGSTHTIKWGVNTSDTFTATGVTSGTSITPSLAATANGGTMTPAAASLTVAVDPSTPSRSMVAGGSTGVIVGQVQLHATNEAITLQKLGLTLANGVYGTLSTGSSNSSNSGTGDILGVDIYQGTTKVGVVTFTGGGQTATSSAPNGGIMNVNLPKDQDTVLTLKANFANISVSDAGGIGDLIKVDPLNAEGTGVSSGTTVQAGATAGVNGNQLFATYPTVAAASSQPVNPNGTNVVIKKYSITAAANPNNRPVSIWSQTFTIATSSANLTNVKLYVYGNDYGNGPDASQNSGTGQIGTTSCASGCVTSPTLIFRSDSNGGDHAVLIPAGTTKYFTLVGTVSPASGATNWTISATLLGDSAASTATSSTGYIATTTANIVTNNNFVWSDNATTTATTTTIDWANGFQVPGLPSIGI